jgi:hypothetical protein
MVKDLGLVAKIGSVCSSKCWEKHCLSRTTTRTRTTTTRTTTIKRWDTLTELYGRNYT